MNLKELKADLDFEVYGEMGIRHYDGKRELPYIVVAAQVLISRVAALLLEKVVCRIKGHAWEDESVAGPDYGDVAGCCTRCGYSYRQVLY